MNTTKNKEFDYQAYMKANPPDTTKLHRGADARKERLQAARDKLMICVDKDILAQFKKLALDNQDYEKLINQALREWLSARDMKELVRDELHQIVHQAFSSAQKEETIP